MLDENGYFFDYKLSLRIFGEEMDFNLISEMLGVAPSTAIRKGEKFSHNGKPTSRVANIDTWIYESPIAEPESFNDHLEYFIRCFSPKLYVISKLKTQYDVDVYCGYLTDCDHAGFEIDSSMLKFFIENDFDLKVSTILS